MKQVALGSRALPPELPVMTNQPGWVYPDGYGWVVPFTVGSGNGRSPMVVNLGVPGPTAGCYGLSGENKSTGE
jgi:hypothetical protein